MLNQDFKEFIQSLNDNQVHYLIVGGYAVAFHGHPRYTKDIDIWIEVEKENASRIIRALDQFGFGSVGLKEEDFLIEDQIIQLGYPPNRIDLLTSLSGKTLRFVTNCECKSKSRALSWTSSIWKSLKKNKQASGRHQDLADLENLE